MQSPLAAITIHPSSQRSVFLFIGLSHCMAMCLLFIPQLPFVLFLFLQLLIAVMAVANIAIRVLQSRHWLQLGRFNADDLQPSIRVFKAASSGEVAATITQVSNVLIEARLLSHFYLPGIIILSAEIPKASWRMLLADFRPWQRRFLRLSLLVSNLGQSRYHFILMAADNKSAGAEAMRSLRSRLKIGRW